MNGWNLVLTEEQQADDPHDDIVVEALAVRLYESDPDSEFNAGDDVQWCHNYAHRDQYRQYAVVARDFFAEDVAPL